MRALKQLIGHQYPKNIDEIIRESIKLRYPFQHFATVIISDQDIIKGITQSKPNNLILNNFGIFLAGLFRTPVSASTYVTVKDILNNDSSLCMYGTVTSPDRIFNMEVGGGTVIQVGSGSTPATRADIAIETPFGNAPEDDVFGTGAGSYATGAIGISGAISAGGAGTINETALLAYWYEETGDAFDHFCLFHDLLVSGEAFVGADTITVAYTINL